MLDKLEKAAKDLRRNEEELRDIGQREEKCNDDLAKACETGDIEDAAVQRIVKDSRMVLDLCDARKRWLKKNVPLLRESVSALLRDVEREFDCFLEVESQKATGVHIAKLSVGFGGDVERGAANFNPNDVPLLEQVRKCRNAEYSSIISTALRRGNRPSQFGAPQYRRGPAKGRCRGSE